MVSLPELSRLNKGINQSVSYDRQVVVVGLDDLKTLLDFVREDKLPRNHPVVNAKDRMGDCLFVARKKERE